MRAGVAIVAVLLAAGSASCSASDVAGRDGQNLLDGAGGGGGDGLGFDPHACTADPAADTDADGYRGVDGDCDDCDASVNPGAFDRADPLGGAPVDDDCSGVADDGAFCDEGLPIDDPDPFAAARALDLCRVAGPGDPGWGVLSARWVRADGTPAATSPQTGLLDGFGPNVRPQGGARLLAISSGHARVPGQPDCCAHYSCLGHGAGAAPAGFPQDTAGCPGLPSIADDVGLDVRVRAPRDATGFQFRFKFYSFEYPEYICTEYNDQFVALVNPPPPTSLGGNISFDAQANPVSVNVAFFDVCPGCPAGDAELVGTGFDGPLGDRGGGTSWLASRAPVTPGGEFSLRVLVWDTGDQMLDSTVLADGFEWLFSTSPIDVTTTPVPDPK